MNLSRLQLSAGRDRSVLLTAGGHALACGAVKTLADAALRAEYPDLCVSDNSEVGHNRYAQPQFQWLNPGQPFLHVAEAPQHTLGLCANGQVHSCLPLLAPEGGAQRHALTGLPAGIERLHSSDSRSYALCRSGTVWSWGLRRGAAPGAPLWEAPAPQTGLPTVTAMATGLGHALALDRRGRVWSWGTNAAGQLGLGDLQARRDPQPLAIDARIVAIGAGDTHSLAIDEHGRLWSWGANNHGQLGPREVDGAYATRPARLTFTTKLAQVEGGLYTSVARSRDGEVFSWGWNGLGQLGQDDTRSAAAPVRVAGLQEVAALAVGQGHVLARTANCVFAWGDNRSAACGVAASQPRVPRPRAMDLSRFEAELQA